MQTHPRGPHDIAHRSAVGEGKGNAGHNTHNFYEKQKERLGTFGVSACKCSYFSSQNAHHPTGTTRHTKKILNASPGRRSKPRNDQDEHESENFRRTDRKRARGGIMTFMTRRRRSGHDLVSTIACVLGLRPCTFHLHTAAAKRRRERQPLGELALGRGGGAKQHPETLQAPKPPTPRYTQDGRTPRTRFAASPCPLLRTKSPDRSPTCGAKCHENLSIPEVPHPTHTLRQTRPVRRLHP